MAGVSASTVSYALNGHRPISAETKAAIEAAVQRLQYRPNAIARSLASKRTHILAILFPHVEHGIGPSEIDLIMEAAKSTIQHGYQLVIWTLETNTDEELGQLLNQELVDGVILMEVHLNDRRIGVLQSREIPFILVGRDMERPEETYIDIDFSATMMDCLTYLKGLGHRRLAFINQSEVSFAAGYGPVVRTHVAFNQFCDNLGLAGREVFCDSDSAGVCGVTEQILTEYPETTAFISMNDRSLPGLIRGLENKRLRIPQDVSLVSIVSSAASVASFLPPITAFEMDIHTLMDSAVTQLAAKIDGRYAELKQRLIPCVLHERQSAGIAIKRPG
jgi:DNA-binding LacI/PurR family transcriptional regulator